MSTDTPLVHVDRRDDGVALVTLDNPKVNALSRDLLRQLEEVAGGLGGTHPGPSSSPVATASSPPVPTSPSSVARRRPGPWVADSGGHSTPLPPSPGA